MILRPPSSTPPYTHFPYTTLFRTASTRHIDVSTMTLIDADGSLTLGIEATNGEMRWLNISRRFIGTSGTRFNGVEDRLPMGAQCLRRSEEHTSELQSLMRISYAVFCLKQKKHTKKARNNTHIIS